MDRHIERLIAIFGVPNRPELTAFYAEVQALMDGYADPLIERAITDLRATQRERGWPSLGRIRDALAAAAHQGGATEKPAAASAWPDASEPHPMLRGAMAERARREGWLLGLNEFLCRFGRLPKYAEMVDLKDSAGCVDAMTSGGNVGVLSGQLQKLARAIVARRRRLELRFDEWGQNASDYDTPGSAAGVAERPPREPERRPQPR